MKKRPISPSSLLIVAIAFAMSFFAGAQALGAQGTMATPPVNLDEEGGVQAHPAHIHEGTCANLGEVVFPLSDVAGVDADATPVVTTTGATPIAEGPAGLQHTVAESTTIVEATLEDILAAEHAINVHESAENIQNYIACGDLTGEPTNGHLEVDLQELNDSGFTGRAELTANPDDTTTVTITLTQDDAGMTGTPEASPAS